MAPMVPNRSRRVAMGTGGAACGSRRPLQGAAAHATAPISSKSLTKSHAQRSAGVPSGISVPSVRDVSASALAARALARSPARVRRLGGADGVPSALVGVPERVFVGSPCGRVIRVQVGDVLGAEADADQRQGGRVTALGWSTRRGPTTP